MRQSDRLHAPEEPLPFWSSPCWTMSCRSEMPTARGARYWLPDKRAVSWCLESPEPGLPYVRSPAKSWLEPLNPDPSRKSCCKETGEHDCYCRRSRHTENYRC